MESPQNRPKPTDTFGKQTKNRPSLFSSRFSTNPDTNTCTPPTVTHRNLDHLADFVEKPTEEPTDKSVSVRFRLFSVEKQIHRNWRTILTKKRKTDEIMFVFGSQHCGYDTTLASDPTKAPACVATCRTPSAKHQNKYNYEALRIYQTPWCTTGYNYVRTCTVRGM